MTIKENQKNIILFVGSLPDSVVKTLRGFKKSHKGQYRLAILKSNTRNTPETEEELATFDVILKCNFNSRKSIVKALKPYEKAFVGVSCRAESKITLFAKAVPHLPYLRTPTSESLEWSTNKVEMRRRLAAYDPKITPAFRVVSDTQKKTLKEMKCCIKKLTK